MDERTTGWLAKLFTFTVFAVMIYISVEYIDPLVKESSRFPGSCNITSVRWYDATCMRDDTFYFAYLVPQIEGVFVADPKHQTSNGSNVLEYVSLFLNKSYFDKQTQGPSGTYRTPTLFDDFSDDPLVNCTSETSMNDMKWKLSVLIPNLMGAFDYTTNSDKFYGAKGSFNCTSNELHGNSAFIDYERTSPLMWIPFVVSLVGVLSGLMLIVKYDIDGPIKAFAEMILQFVGLFFYAVNFVIWLIIMVIIGQVIFNKDPGDPTEFMSKGSIFIPVIWLFKKAKVRCHRGSEVADSPPNSSPIRITVRRGSGSRVTDRTSESTPQAMGRRGSAPHILARPNAPDSGRPHAALEKPPSYPSIDVEGTVITNVITQYHPDTDNADVLPPPPSYDEAINYRMS